MRIAQVLGNSKFGGGVWVILWLAQALRAKGHKVFILASDPVVSKKFRQEGFEVYTTKYFRREIAPVSDIKAGFALARLLKSLRVSVVHTHTSKAGFIGRIAARLIGIPYILHTVHGFAFHEFSTKKSILFYSILERFAARFCDRIIFVNQKDYDWALQLKIAKAQKMRVVYNGIDWERVAKIKPYPNLRQELGLDKDTILLSFTGRLSRQKNLFLLIDALALLPQNFCLLIIGGDLDCGKELREYVKKLNLQERVFFLGFRTDIIPLIKATDIFVLPSLWEGLSISLLEAMAAGLPVVASNIKGTNEVICSGENGLLFSPQDKKELVNKILSLIDSSGRLNSFAKKLAQAGEATVRNRFSQAQFAKESLFVYEELIPSRELATVGSGRIEDNPPKAEITDNGKRACDLIVASTLFILTLPLFLLIAITIKITSGGPILFKQIRAGRKGKPFVLYKFRTMKLGSPDLRNPDGSTYNSPSDSRLTKIGKFLRKTSLDELPSIINVLKGEMSIVGPRPDLIDQVSYYAKGDERRLEVLPGITGLAQIAGRNQLPWRKRRRFDCYYVTRLISLRRTNPIRALLFDLSIILRTIPLVISQKGIFIPTQAERPNK